MDFNNQLTCIEGHYQKAWGYPTSTRLTWPGGLEWQLPLGFNVLEVPPHSQRPMWTYATIGMSAQGDAPPLELHLFSQTQYQPHAELLSSVAHYHCTGDYLGLSHTVNFGRPWMPESHCDHGLISLPYLDGPLLEWGDIAGRKTRFLWLVPISNAEKTFRHTHGMEALESLFESRDFDYFDPLRISFI